MRRRSPEWVRSTGEEWVLSRGGWATVEPGTVRVRLRESASSAGCNQGSPAMISNKMFSVGSASGDLIYQRMVEFYLSIERGEGWVVAVWRDAKGVGGG